MTFGEVFSSWNRGGVLGNAAASRTRFMSFAAVPTSGKEKSRIGFQAYLRSGAGTPRRTATPRRGGGSDSPWHQYRPRCSSVPTTPRRHARQADPEFVWRDSDGAPHLSPRAPPPSFGRESEAGFWSEAATALKTWPTYPPEHPVSSRPESQTSAAPTPAATEQPNPGFSSRIADTPVAPPSQGAPPSSNIRMQPPLSARGSSPRRTPDALRGGKGYAQPYAAEDGAADIFTPPAGPPKGGQDTRISSFVRLNNFLLRTHITSIVSALAEDGWIEAWEKERICRCTRESTSSTAQAFVRVYGHFVETSDVPAFVRALKANIN